MSELTDLATKLSKLGRVLEGVKEGVDFMDGLAESQSKLQKSIADAKAELAKLESDKAAANAAIAAAKNSANAAIQAAKNQAADIVIAGEAEAAELKREAQGKVDDAHDAAELVMAEIDKLKVARAEAEKALAAVKQDEQTVLARIAKAKEDAKRSLGL